MTHILTIVGTRPELIRLSVIIQKLDRLPIKHTLVHTGQNYDVNLSSIFFKDLGIREPNYFLNVYQSSFTLQIGEILNRIEEVLIKEKPDKVLILGDTNSALSAIVCRRLGIPVYHMEAGNRCFDAKVPEELNRKIVDSISDFNLPYTRLSKENLIHDGVAKEKIYVVGNPINEVLIKNNKYIKDSLILERERLVPCSYILSTFHRSENVDTEERLRYIVSGLEKVAEEFNKPVYCSIHPRTRNKIEQFKIEHSKKLHFMTPLGFHDFVKLEQYANLIITDSGTVVEEACILGIPSVVIRDTTERPELIEVGACILSSLNPDNILRCSRIIKKRDTKWRVPEEYTYEDTSDRVIQILTGEIK